MKVLGMHDGGGCGYWRVMLPLRELAVRGHQVFEHCYQRGHIDKVLTQAADYDVILAQRLVDLSLLPFWKYAQLVTRTVLEHDDDIFAIENSNIQAAPVFGRPDVIQAMKDSARSAGAITVSTEPLGDVFREYNRDVRVVPNLLPEQAFAVNNSFPHPTDRKVLGWVGGSSHSKDLQVAAPAVRRVIAENKDWDLEIRGHDFSRSFAVPEDRMRVMPWLHVLADEAAYFTSLDSIDVGIAPVLDSEFNHGKSAIKAMEYAARGIPVVASDVRAYKDYVVHGVTGFLARTVPEWHEYMSLLMTDDGLRLQMGAAARNMALNFRLSSYGELWERALS